MRRCERVITTFVLYEQLINIGRRFQRFPFLVCCKIFTSTFGTKTTQFLLDPLTGPKCLFRFSLNSGLVSAEARNEVFKTGQENKCSFFTRGKEGKQIYGKQLV